jgi:hypothetical protein
VQKRQGHWPSFALDFAGRSTMSMPASSFSTYRGQNVASRKEAPCPCRRLRVNHLSVIGAADHPLRNSLRCRHIDGSGLSMIHVSQTQGKKFDATCSVTGSECGVMPMPIPPGGASQGINEHVPADRTRESNVIHASFFTRRTRATTKLLWKPNDV